MKQTWPNLEKLSNIAGFGDFQVHRNVIVKNLDLAILNLN